MRIVQGIDQLGSLAAGSVLSVGNFDGMHIGHRHLVKLMRDLAMPIGAQVVLVTFDPHPLTVIRPSIAPPLLTPLAKKQEMMAQAGVDVLVVLPPTKEVLGLTAEAFWEILRDQARISHLVEGRSFTFGRGRKGNVQRLMEWSAGTQVTLHVVDPVEVELLNMEVAPVSSSVVRWLLIHGRVREAAKALGRAYQLWGTVEKGHQRGRQLGFPTANLKCVDQLIPADGVYAGNCLVDGHSYQAAISIGTMPTFGEYPRQVEAHLLDFQGDIYGREVVLELVDWVRDQMKFPSVDLLRARMNKDLQWMRFSASSKQ
ncbi:MAG: riboflavin biosynthesis protein RibF [Phycisphaerales bacterium]|jgi:riboflavin kinase/FMN adenylyltransferase|nr:riboflavin biosynthesis protein RibF [Phycisphaerales bacterium]